jgi:plasmid maintenance system antidote protein VapI
MPLDNELIKMRMQCANLNVAQLSEISGVAANKLSLFVNGTRGIRNDEITRLRETLAEVEHLIEIASPWPLNFKNTSLIRELLERARHGEFDRGSDVNK